MVLHFKNLQLFTRMVKLHRVAIRRGVTSEVLRCFPESTRSFDLRVVATVDKYHEYASMVENLPGTTDVLTSHASS